MRMPKISLAISLILTAIVWWSCSNEKNTTILSGNLTYVVSEKLHTSANSTTPEAKPLTSLQPSEYLITDEGLLTDFKLLEYSSMDGSPSSHIHKFSAHNKTFNIQKELIVTTYDHFPGFITTRVTYTNFSDKDLLIKAWVNNQYEVLPQEDEPPFWAFQGSSSSARADWIQPITPGYYKKNYMGMNNSDYGGGIPVTDIWRSDMGIAVGHTELTPKLISLPTELKKYTSNAQVGVQEDFDYPTYLKAGDSLETFETFVTTHSGDYYTALQRYSEFMQAKGLTMPPAEPSAFEPIWCAWGYERNFQLDEIIGTLPKVKELGIKWAVLDDGFQQAEGDWHTNKQKFPGGDAQMKSLVEEIHNHGLKAKLWWTPLAADPTSQLLKKNPKMRLYLDDWSPQYITWWDAYYLSPTHPKTKQHTQETVDLFLNEWGFDGLKMDGQHMNAVAPDHNPESGLENPIQAHERLPEFFKLIYEETLKIKPNAVVENCPCGTCMSFFNMPYMNQAVSSDPLSSWQIRHKGKTYKALIPNTAYYGDHVELSDGGDDFASSFGIGAVLGTKFTWPKDNPDQSESFLLTPKKEKVWKKWLELYNQKMLSKEAYLGNLYDIGYDQPEAHVIQKGDTLHYAFYADKWDGAVELRGLSEATYIVIDYFNHQRLGEITSNSPTLDVQFEDFILLEVYPK